MIMTIRQSPSGKIGELRVVTGRQTSLVTVDWKNSGELSISVPNDELRQMLAGVPPSRKI